MSRKDNVCEYIPYVTLDTPGIDELTKLRLESEAKGWVFGGGHDERTDELRGTFQVISRIASFMPSIHEVAAALPDPVEGEVVSVELEHELGPVVVFEGKMGDTFRALCGQLVVLTTGQPEEHEADIVTFPRDINR